MVKESQVFLSKTFHLGISSTNTNFENPIDNEIMRWGGNLKVRLLAIHSTSTLPPSLIYVNGLRRKVFGTTNFCSYFPIHSVEDLYFDPQHIHSGLISFGGFQNWQIRITDLSGKLLVLAPKVEIIVHLGISKTVDKEMLPEYFTFNFDNESKTVELQTFKKINPCSTLALVDFHSPKLANVFPPFNFVTVSGSFWRPELNAFTHKVKLNIPIDYYSKEQLRGLLIEKLNSYDNNLKGDDYHHKGDVLDYEITPHRRMVTLLNIKGGGIPSVGDLFSFKMRDIVFGEIDPISPVPNTFFLTCNLVKPNILCGNYHRIMKMLYSDNNVKGPRCEKNMNNIHHIQMSTLTVKSISFDIIDCQGNTVYLADAKDNFNGTLMINSIE